MSKPALFFAHANGFPASCYHSLFTELEPNFDILTIDCLGHNPNHPVVNGWEPMVIEIIEAIEASSRSPVMGVGHSLGGGVLYMAALKRPELFSQVIMLDTPIFGPLKSSFLGMAKRMGWIDRVTPALRTKVRKQTFQSRESAKNYFATKGLFENFTEAALNDYVNYGLVEQGDRLTLKFKRQIEYQIFRNLPHHLYRQFHRQQVPISVIVGEQSDVITAADRRNFTKRVAKCVVGIPGTHMFPFEHTKQCSELIEKLSRNSI